MNHDRKCNSGPSHVCTYRDCRRAKKAWSKEEETRLERRNFVQYAAWAITYEKGTLNTQKLGGEWGIKKGEWTRPWQKATATLPPLMKRKKFDEFFSSMALLKRCCLRKEVHCRWDLNFRFSSSYFSSFPPASLLSLFLGQRAGRVARSPRSGFPRHLSLSLSLSRWCTF